MQHGPHAPLCPMQGCCLSMHQNHEIACFYLGREASSDPKTDARLVDDQLGVCLTVQRARRTARSSLGTRLPSPHVERRSLADTV